MSILQWEEHISSSATPIRDEAALKTMHRREVYLG